MTTTTKAIWFKLEYENEFRRFSKDSLELKISGFQWLSETIETYFQISHFLITYKDEEGDEVTLGSEVEFQYLLTNCENKTMKLKIKKITPIKSPAFSSSSSILFQSPLLQSTFQRENSQQIEDQVSFNTQEFSIETEPKPIKQSSPLYTASHTLSSTTSNTLPSSSKLLSTSPTQMLFTSPSNILSIPEPEALSAPKPETLSIPQPENLSISEPEALSVIQPEALSVIQPEALSVLQPETLSISEPEVLSVPQPETLSVPQPETLYVPQPFVPQANILSSPSSGSTLNPFYLLEIFFHEIGPFYNPSSKESYSKVLPLLSGTIVSAIISPFHDCPFDVASLIRVCKKNSALISPLFFEPENVNEMKGFLDEFLSEFNGNGSKNLYYLIKNSINLLSKTHKIDEVVAELNACQTGILNENSFFLESNDYEHSRSISTSFSESQIAFFTPQNENSQSFKEEIEIKKKPEIIEIKEHNNYINPTILYSDTLSEISWNVINNGNDVLSGIVFGDSNQPDWKFESVSFSDSNPILISEQNYLVKEKIIIKLMVKPNHVNTKTSVNLIIKLKDLSGEDVGEVQKSIELIPLIDKLDSDLQEFGFKESEKNKSILKKHKNDVQLAAAELSSSTFIVPN